MGGGDLNLKKSWHPTTLKNMERVWKAEQKHEAEKKKIEELQRELAEERAREEIQHYAEEQGVVKKKSSERLDWMYEGPSSMVNREDYLLGRNVDKTFEMLQQNELGGTAKAEGNALPESILKSSAGNVTVDLANKIREDPLLVIKKQEDENKRKLLDNPVRMKQLQQLLHTMNAKKKKKKLKKEKKSKKAKKSKSKKHRKKQRSDSSSSDDGSSEEEADAGSKMRPKRRDGGRCADDEVERSRRSQTKDVSNGKRDRPSSSSRHHRRRSSSAESPPRGHPERSVGRGGERSTATRDSSEMHWQRDERRRDRSPSRSPQRHPRSGRRDDRKRDRSNEGGQQSRDHGRNHTANKSPGRNDRRSSPNRHDGRQNRSKPIANSQNSSASLSPQRAVRRPDRHLKRDRSASLLSSSPLRSCVPTKRPRPEEKRPATRNSTSGSSSDSEHRPTAGRLGRANGDCGAGGDGRRSRSRSLRRIAAENIKREKVSSSPEVAARSKPRQPTSVENNSVSLARSNKQLSAEEKQKRLEEMLENARWRDDQRSANLRRHRDEMKMEKQLQMKNAGTDFITPFLNKAADVGTVSSRIKSNIYNIQRTKAALDKSFTKR